MDENKLKAIVEDAINNAVNPIKQMLEDPDSGLSALNRRMDANTAAVVELESTVKGYADSYKINDTNIRKVEKRLETLEENSGVNVPPELQLAPQSDL